MKVWFENILRLIIVMLVQLLLINNLNFLGICTPFIYILFLLQLPAKMPRWCEMLLGAAVGLVMDIFCNSIGVHFSACVLIAYLRPLLIKNLVVDNERLTGTINAASLGWQIYVKEVIILTLVHHTCLFVLEAFSFQHFWMVVLQIIASAIVSILLILGYEIVKQ